MNLGHASEQTTRRNYGKMTQTEQLGETRRFNEERPFTDDEKDLMLDLFENRLHRDTPEFKLAKKLAALRENGLGDDVLDPGQGGQNPRDMFWAQNIHRSTNRNLSDRPRYCIHSPHWQNALPAQSRPATLK